MSGGGAPRRPCRGARGVACALIKALQLAPMSADALMDEAEAARDTVDDWLHAFRDAGLIEPAGRAANRAALWRWKQEVPPCGH